MVSIPFVKMQVRIYVLQLQVCEDEFHELAGQNCIPLRILNRMLDKAENEELVVKAPAMMFLALRDMAMVSK